MIIYESLHETIKIIKNSEILETFSIDSSMNYALFKDKILLMIMNN